MVRRYRAPFDAGAGWLAADLASFADPTGTVSTIAHAGKIKSAKRVSKIFKWTKRTKRTKRGKLKLDLQLFSKNMFPLVQSVEKMW